MKSIYFLMVLLVLQGGCTSRTPSQWELSSPGGKLEVAVSLDAAGRPFYQARFQGQAIMDTSYLGFELLDAPDLKQGFRIVSGEESAFNETWEQPWGEVRYIRNHYRQLRVALQEKQGLKRRLDLVFRLYDDGLGFRYEFPEQAHLRNFVVGEELTEFHLTGDHRAWWIPAHAPNRYEYLYRDTPLSQMGKVHTPVTFQADSHLFISLHEAALKDYSSMVVDAGAGPRLRCELVPYSLEEAGKAFLSAPGHTPWRTLQVATRPGDLITSYLILNLNEPNQLGDVSWFKPGKYLGIWWEMHIGAGTWASGEAHAANTANTRRYIDFAAQHGFDGVLVEGWNQGWDGNWTEAGDAFSFTQSYPDYDLDSLCTYAEARGVYLVGHHETAGAVDNYERQMADAFALMADHGMRAVKTGYVEHGNLLTNGKYHHGQAFVEHFHKVIRMAAQHRVAVVAHEPIKDTGERRTYPNMVSREGARGQEFNAWSADGGNPPAHTLILPFTRGLAGPMDFTPGVFDLEIPSRPHNRVQTTLAKQLALYVVMYAPLQMACDLPEHYMRHPDAFDFIKEVAVDWDTTLVPEAGIGTHIVVARKARDRPHWFLGAMTNEEAREVRIPLSFLSPHETYEAHIYRDAADAHYLTKPTAYQIERRQVAAGDTLTTWLAPGGGLAVSLFQTESPTITHRQ